MATSDRTEAPLTRTDMQDFLADFKWSVAEELERKLSPIMEAMADLTARTQATETKMEGVQESVHAHTEELQDLRDQLRILEDSNEDLNKRTRWHNIRVRGLPETVSTDLLPDTLTRVFQYLLPDATMTDLLMERAHHALRAPSANTGRYSSATLLPY
ncbi:Hypothetical predicted protein [Pelobates cultripes]|uniref:Uncharacterized protein n=1 Tax=Pelobates cultripes TaxID=61616 RepID=A0AAD1WT68_PELCU|nr:Hypothetical predicted protein [Pelobates cultripes]